MKICFLITGLGTGGAERHLLNLVPKLKFEKFIISLLNLNDFGKQIEKKGIKIYYLGLNKLNLLSVIIRFRKIIKKENPDILDTYLIHSNLFGRFFGRLFGVKKIIASIRNDYSEFKILNFIDRISCKLVDLYILNSKSLLNYVHKKNHIPSKKIEIIPNGIDLIKIYSELNKNNDVRKELGLKSDSFVVLCVSRLYKHKNISILLKAFKLVNKNIYLVIIGEGPEKKNLKRLLEKLNMCDNIFFLNKRRDVHNIIYNSNVFVLPSLREGMSNVLLEAMALKKICIVSNIPQNRELIKDGFNGFVFDPKNERDLTEKIMRIYKNKNIELFGLKSFKVIQKNYDIEQIINKYENIVKIVYDKP